jgi:hypothetical protein
MFVHPESRGKNIAKILEELESGERIIVLVVFWKRAKISKAIAYKRMVTITTNYGQYEGIDDSFVKSFLRRNSITLMEPLI